MYLIFLFITGKSTVRSPSKLLRIKVGKLLFCKLQVTELQSTKIMIIVLSIEIQILNC